MGEERVKREVRKECCNFILLIFIVFLSSCTSPTGIGIVATLSFVSDDGWLSREEGTQEEGLYVCIDGCMLKKQIKLGSSSSRIHTMYCFITLKNTIKWMVLV